MGSELYQISPKGAAGKRCGHRRKYRRDVVRVSHLKKRNRAHTESRNDYDQDNHAKSDV